MSTSDQSLANIMTLAGNGNECQKYLFQLTPSPSSRWTPPWSSMIWKELVAIATPHSRQISDAFVFVTDRNQYLKVVSFVDDYNSDTEEIDVTTSFGWNIKSNLLATSEGC